MMKVEEMPKIELHVHLDGSVRLETLKEILGDIKREDVIANNCQSLEEYLEKFDLPIKAMQSKENLERVAYELTEDLKDDNVIYAEIRFAPLKHTKEGLDVDEVVESVLNGLKKGKIKTNLILCLMRGDDFASNLKVVESAIKYLGSGVCGLDLAGDEDKYSLNDYKELFAIAKDNDIPFTIHAGETGNSQNIKEAIDMGAKRIGHGISAVNDKFLIQELIEKQIVLEVCPTSNVDTKAVSKYIKHPVYNLYKKGLLITINTDNKLVSNITLTEEYARLINTFGFLKEDFINMNKNAINGAFISDSEKEELLKKLSEIA